MSSHYSSSSIQSGAMDKTIEFLENCDLNPKYKEQKVGSRNPLAGVITILYFPLLILYLWYTIQPQYGSLPSCCTCAIPDTPLDSWIYLAQNETCSNNKQCKDYVQSQLKLNCDAALQYLPVPDYNLTINIAQIGCVGLKPGDTCDETCMEVSNRWITNVDYTFQDNRYQAKIRCPLQVGVCDFKAIYSVQETTPHAVCRYPELKGIFTSLGAGLGLLNGLLITFRGMLRTFWNRIGTRDGGGGGLSDYWKGIVIGIVFNYFGIMYLTLATGINKRLRYGGQLAIGFLIIFFKTPFVVYLIIVFSQYWTPMLILLVMGCMGVSILIRTTFNLIILEIHSRNCVVMSQDVEQFEHYEEQIQFVRPSRIKPVIHSQWRHFVEGFLLNIFAVYPLMVKHSIKRYSGMKAGFYCSISIMSIIAIWSLLFALNGWEYITYNFPFPLNRASKTSGNNGGNTDSSSASPATDSSNSPTPPPSSLPSHYLITDQYTQGGGNIGDLGLSSSGDDLSSLEFGSDQHKVLYKTAFLQSLYFAITWALAVVFVYHLSLFIKYLPERKSIIPSFLKKSNGTKMDFRVGFMVSFIPLLLTYFCFFYFEFIPYVTGPLPQTPSQCSFPGWTLIIPILGILPALGLFLFAYTERFRWGCTCAIGCSLIVFCLGTSVLLFNYCLGPTQAIFYPWSWIVGLIGTYILIYGAIRPNQIFILDKKNHHREYLEEERLLQDKQDRAGNNTPNNNFISNNNNYNEIRSVLYNSQE